MPTTISMHSTHSQCNDASYGVCVLRLHSLFIEQQSFSSINTQRWAQFRFTLIRTWHDHELEIEPNVSEYTANRLTNCKHWCQFYRTMQQYRLLRQRHSYILILCTASVCLYFVPAQSMHTQHVNDARNLNRKQSYTHSIFYWRCFFLHRST